TGQAGNASVGGAVALVAGAGDSNAGGTVLIAGGAGNNNSNGGDVTIRGGALDGTGTAGAVNIGSSNTSTINLGVNPRFPVATKAVGGTAIGNANAVGEGFTLVTGADNTAA